MKRIKVRFPFALTAILLLGTIIAGCSSSSFNIITSPDLETISSDAAIYGFPAVIMDKTRKVMTNVPNPNESHAPINQFALARYLADATFTDIVRLNNDTLYELAWIDVGKEPWLLSVPDTKGKYYVMQLMNYWTDVFAAPGPRTTGTGAGVFAITGPGWNGALPAGVTELKSSTRYAWLFGRITCNNSSDYQNVWNLQNQLKLTPLSAWGTAYIPPSTVPTDPSVNMKDTPVDQVMTMDAVTFFSALCQIMVDNPSYAADAQAMANFAGIGIIPGTDFKAYFNTLDSALQQAIVSGHKKGIAKIPTITKGFVKTNGWAFTYGTGEFGTNYDYRAKIAYTGLGANLGADALYPSSFTLPNNEKYSSDNKYLLHFNKDQIPPVNAFWSLTMYNEQQAMAPNSINRYKVGSLSEPALKFNGDGSLDIYIQRDAPDTDKFNNWLPTPATGSFSLSFRLYWPKESVLNKSWLPPAMQLVQ